MQLRLDGMPVAEPTRYISPGDIVKKKRTWKQKATATPRPKPEPKDNRRPNPFREPVATQDELDFRHMQWAPTRAKVDRLLTSVNTSQKALHRFQHCGAECMVEFSKEANRYRLRASYCRCRHCQPCQRAKGQLIALNLTEKLKAGAAQDGDRFRFITLTLRHSKRPLKDQIANLYEHFRKLRGSKLWKASQRGGAVMLEVSLNDKREWHPHLHIISEGDFIRQDKLANHWMEITGGSFKVDVRPINTGKDAAQYVAKYVSKGTTANVWDDRDRAQEWILAMKGVRSCSTFGTWRGFALAARHPTEKFEDWKPVGLLQRICDDARRGEDYACGLVLHLADSLQYDPSRGRRKEKSRPD